MSAPAPETVLCARDLTIGYGGGREPVVVAHDLQLDLLAGEMVCLIGPNGAGKSTLLRTMAGMQPPLSGEVLLLGDPVHELKQRELARRLSIVLTERIDPGLLTGYALVALGRHPHTDWSGRLSPYDEAVVRWAVEAVGAQDLAEKPFAQLSDGQRQKLLIARALAQEPAVMLLDEPTAYLDLPRRVEVLYLLRALARETGRAVMLSTHDLDLALRSADRIWLVDGAGGVAVGAPEDLVLSGAFESAFQAQGVRFDAATGSFAAPQPVGRVVQVQGAGLAAYWTRRALERAGYQPADDVQSAPLVEVTGDDETIAWILRQDGLERRFDVLYDLLRTLATL